MNNEKVKQHQLQEGMWCCVPDRETAELINDLACGYRVCEERFVIPRDVAMYAANKIHNHMFVAVEENPTQISVYEFIARIKGEYQVSPQAEPTAIAPIFEGKVAELLTTLVKEVVGLRKEVAELNSKPKNTEPKEPENLRFDIDKGVDLYSDETGSVIWVENGFRGGLITIDPDIVDCHIDKSDDCLHYITFTKKH